MPLYPSLVASANQMQNVCVSQRSLAHAASSLTTLILHMQPSWQCCCGLQAKLDMFVAMQQLLQQATGPAWSDFAGCSEKLVQIMLEHIGRYNKTCCLASCVVC